MADLNAAIDSAGRVMGMFNSIEDNRRRDRLLDHEMQNSNERMAMARTQESRAEQLFDAQMAQQNRAARSQRVKEAAGIFAEFEAKGMEPPDELYAKVWPDLGLDESFFGDDYSRNFEVAEGILQGKVKANSTEGLAALNSLFRKQVMDGNGVTKDGRRIVDKRIASAVPSPDGKGFMLDLEVLTEDGRSYRAPVTESRDSDDEKDPYVKVIPWEAAMDNLAGQRMVYSAMSPEQRQRIRAMVIGASGLRQQTARRGSGMTFEERAALEKFKQDSANSRSLTLQGMRDESADLRDRRKLAADEFADYQANSALSGSDGSSVPTEVIKAKIDMGYGIATPEQQAMLQQFEQQQNTIMQHQYVDKARQNLDPVGPNFLRQMPSEDQVYNRAAELFAAETGQPFTLQPPAANRTGAGMRGTIDRGPAAQPIPKSPAAARGGQSGASAPQISSKAEYDALPSGTRYLHPDGTIKVKK